MHKLRFIPLLALLALFSCSKQKHVEIVTDYGTMHAVLFDETPKHRDNFIKLAHDHFYDSLLFHRVIKGFMIQGGDPDSMRATPDQMLGMSGPGYTIPAEMVIGKWHFKGALCAARTGDQINPKRESSGSQFYIVHGGPVNLSTLADFSSANSVQYSDEDKAKYLEDGGKPMLDGQYTVFGQVDKKDFDVIDKIAAAQTQNDRPLKDIRMTVREYTPPFPYFLVIGTAGAFLAFVGLLLYLIKKGAFKRKPKAAPVTPATPTRPAPAPAGKKKKK